MCSSYNGVFFSGSSVFDISAAQTTEVFVRVKAKRSWVGGVFGGRWSECWRNESSCDREHVLALNVTMVNRIPLSGNMYFHRLIPLLLLAHGVLSVASAAPLQQGRLQYNRDIRPILSDNCFACHGPDKAKRDSGLRLDVRESALKEAKSGDIAIVPGHPDASQMIARIFSDDKDDIMPPPDAHKTLSPAQKELLKRWIAEGAVYEPHWAYAPIRSSQELLAALPDAVDSKWSTHPVDRFVQARLKEQQLSPAPEADRRTLIRRLSLDLTGLPPTVAEVRAFEADSTPNAYGNVLERLLASPHYGERMAQQWLDLARYADTVGFHGDQNQHVFAYRDYVIDSFNQNKPFDQFTTEQLAGDLLPNPTEEQLIATCFNRLNMMTREGGAQPKEYITKYTADRIRTVGTTWLGSTLGCAECHDHKFDPWTQKDVYSLGAFFADIEQWGVYSDYPYTPNPDLKGFTNDYPFPPEILVKNRAMQAKLDAARERMTRAVAMAAVPAERLAKWVQTMRDFLAKHPTGWESPESKISITVPKAEFTQTKDGLVTLKPSSERQWTLDFKPTASHVAMIRIELESHGSEDGRILRGKEATLKPAFSVVRKSGKVMPLEIFHAEADRYKPRYNSGDEVPGVQESWRLVADDATQNHASVWHLAQPLVLATGDQLRVVIPANTLNAVRVRTSPMALPDLALTTLRYDFAGDLAKAPEALYLRSTGWHPGAFEELRAADFDALLTRGGRTPVLVTKRTANPLTVRILPRGNWQDETGAICKPETAHFLPKLPEADQRELTRLDLAKWLVSRENPLTARVAMNRLWRQFFGIGLSAQVDDLGAQGESPSHPELLDYLAARFQDGWNWKDMVRLIVTSHTYRQISGLRPMVRESDPLNRLLCSQNPRRLDAEFVRDNALAIAGLLNLEMGGPACKPYQPDDYYTDIQFPTRKYEADTGPEQWRRGVYMWWQRTFVHPMLLNFDAPSREDCVALRTQANTPQQALTLLNDPTFVEAARVWATRLRAMPCGDRERIQTAFEEALGRLPLPAEIDSLLAALAQAREIYQSQPQDAQKLLRIGATPVPTETSVPAEELAAWSTVCRVVLNLHETITRF